MDAAREQDAVPAPVSAAEVRGWFDGEDPVSIIDARLLQLVQSARQLDPELVWDILAILDQNHRRGRLSAVDYRRLKGRVERQALQAQDTDTRTSAPTRVLAARQSIGSFAARDSDFEADASPGAGLDDDCHADDEEEDHSVPLPVRRPALRVTTPPTSMPAAALTATGPAAPVAAAGVQPGPDTTVFVARPGLLLSGRYTLQREIGEGGISTIWLATDQHRVDSGGAGHVAIKLLRGSFASRPDAVRALRHEFDAAQRLAHPAIIRVHDLDVDGALTFLTMEPLRGELLSDLIRRLQPNALERSQAWALIALLGEALVHAHDRDVIHADVKPGNVMITERGELRLFDFGAAWQAQREPWIYETRSPRLQAATPTYASAERLSGNVPTTRDDVFSFCCVAYELLTGLHPFDRQPANHAQENRLRVRRVDGLTRRQWRALERGLSFDWDARPSDLRRVLGELGLTCASGAQMPLDALRPAAPPVRGGASWFTLLVVGAVAFAAVYVLNGGQLPEPQRIVAGAQALGHEAVELAGRLVPALRSGR